MPADSNKIVNPYAYTQNRELSWLRFNLRVLEEAADETVPLLERLKFIAIFTSNLDEFIMVRVGSLFDLSQISPEKIDSRTGMTPMQQLQKIYQTIPGLITRKNQIYQDVLEKLNLRGIFDLTFDQLSAAEQKYIHQYFKRHILSVLSPQIVDSHHPFPHLANKALYIAAMLENKKGRPSLGFLPVPSSLPAFVCMPDNPGRFIRMENILLHWAPSLFGSYRSEEFCCLCVTRNADISYDEEKFEDQDEDFRNHMSKLLKKRARLSIMRLEISKHISENFRKLLENRVHIKDNQTYFNESPLVMKYVFALEKQLPPAITQPLLFSPYRPRWPEDLDEKRSMIKQIQERDRLLFFPFDRIDPFLQLLSEAAERPDVISIKITIYRLAASSKIVRTLCRAAENKKEVTVLMELRARFDEANNIFWSKTLEEAGCQVIYGIEDYKCHSKICLITLRSKGQLHYITQIGTGNYNEKTSTAYTDLSFMTADEKIGLDGIAFFRNMLIGNLNGNYERLLVSPSGIKTLLLDRIGKEAAKGPDGYIRIKANSLTERDVIDKLAEASASGTKIQLILRGICCLRPGIPHMTENIQVTSIVGRYLEHARIYCFGQGPDAEFYLSSADLMSRNLNRRIEIACPIQDKEIKRQLDWILHTQLEDNVKASELLPDGSYLKKQDSKHPLNSQSYFMEQSFHHRASSEKVQSKLKTPFSLLKTWFAGIKGD